MAEKLSTGKLLEAKLEDRLSWDFNKKSCSRDFVPTADTTADYLAGTDAIIWGIPVDFTTDALKDNTVWSDRAVTLLNGVEVRFGVRTGNSHNGYTEFDTPTLVLFIRVFMGNLRYMMDDVVDAFSEKFDDVFDAGEEFYYGFMDSMEPC